MAAVRANDFDLVQALVSHGARIRRAEYHCTFTTLQLACGARDVVQSNHERDLKFIWLHAVDPRIAEFLLKQGVDPNGRGNLCCISPLQLAEDPRVVQLLLTYGADAKEIITRCEACAKLEMKIYGVNWRLHWQECDDVRGILHIAVLRSVYCRTGESRRIVELLLDEGANINERTGARWWHARSGHTALELAAGVRDYPHAAYYSCGDIETVRILLGRKAQVNPAPDYQGPSALAAACATGDLDMIKLLLNHGMSPNPVHSCSPPPLSEAA